MNLIRLYKTTASNSYLTNKDVPTIESWFKRKETRNSYVTQKDLEETCYDGNAVPP